MNQTGMVQVSKRCLQYIYHLKNRYTYTRSTVQPLNKFPNCAKIKISRKINLRITKFLAEKNCECRDRHHKRRKVAGNHKYYAMAMRSLFLKITVDINNIFKIKDFYSFS